jgi:predicted transcriptional regulator
LATGVRSRYTTIVGSSTAKRVPASPASPDPMDSPAIPTRALVLGMAQADGTIHAAEVYPVAEACTLTSEQVRSCLRRLVSEGLFERSGEGRDARYEATPAGLRVLESAVERTRLAYAQDAAGRGWDRQWRLVAFAIPETKRAARDGFRDTLLDLGGAPVQNGLYVSPHAWTTEIRDAAERLGVPSERFGQRPSPCPRNAGRQRRAALDSRAQGRDGRGKRRRRLSGQTGGIRHGYVGDRDRGSRRTPFSGRIR